MKKISLQWRLTCIITLYIAVICGCLTLLVYKNGIYYIDSLQETVDARGDDAGDQGGDGTADGSDQIYISIPEDKWDEFANDDARRHWLANSINTFVNALRWRVSKLRQTSTE